MTREVILTVPTADDATVRVVATYHYEPAEYFDGYGTRPGYWALDSIDGFERQLSASERDRAEMMAAEITP